MALPQIISPHYAVCVAVAALSRTVPYSAEYELGVFGTFGIVDYLDVHKRHSLPVSSDLVHEVGRLKRLRLEASRKHE